MNKIETLVYNAVRKNPALKQFIRNAYQQIFDLLPRKKDYFSFPYDFREGYFFGFHDVSPLSKDESKLLALHNSFDLRMPKPSEGLEIGYFDFNNGTIGEWHKLGKSLAWNYHKGCRLQWLDNERIIYNTFENNNVCSQILNTNDLSTTTINYPIDATFCNKNKCLATSFSYERLERCMPGYGYPYSDNGQITQPAPDDTGLFLINLNTGERELLLSIKDIALKVTGIIEDNYLHFVTHTEFSPDGRYISFLYRRIPTEGDFMKRRSVICVYDLDKKNLIVLPTQESGSHYVWNSRNELLASVIIDGKNCHSIFSLNEQLSFKMIDPDHLNSDGHQSFISDTRFVTDTYPDKWRMANIYLVDIKNDKSSLITRVYSPKSFQTNDFHCHIACDLHPRVIGNGKYVCFDSVRSGKRGIYVMNLNNIEEN